MKNNLLNREEKKLVLDILRRQLMINASAQNVISHSAFKKSLQKELDVMISGYDKICAMDTVENTVNSYLRNIVRTAKNLFAKNKPTHNGE